MAGGRESACMGVGCVNPWSLNPLSNSSETPSVSHAVMSVTGPVYNRRIGQQFV